MNLLPGAAWECDTLSFTFYDSCVLRVSRVQIRDLAIVKIPAVDYFPVRQKSRLHEQAIFKKYHFTTNRHLYDKSSVKYFIEMITNKKFLNIFYVYNNNNNCAFVRIIDNPCYEKGNSWKME